MTSTNTQSNLFDQPRPGSNMPEYGVTEISKLLKKTVEETFGLVRVRGEISECKYHSNGHVYMTLKDEGAILAAVCWRGQVGKLGIKPEVGMDVVCTGRLTTYAGQSKYQMVVDGMTLAGVGALLKMLEERKKKLAAEGLFDPARKQELPFLPEVIGVVTSPTGAVIRDILHRLDDRFPRRVLVWPVAVQGQGAAEQIAAAIEGFNALDETGDIPRPDVIIVARGGGSVEDLMPFNEEIVVRAAAASHIALISAVGHETDTTLIDFAADKRAPTPTAAAEMAVPVRVDLMAQVGDEGMRLFGGIRRILQDLRERVSLTERALGDPARVIEPLMQRLDERTERMMLAWDSDFGRRDARLAEAKGKLRHPRDVIAMKQQSFEERSARLDLGWSSFIERRGARISEVAARIRHPREQFALAQQKLENTEPRLKTALRENFQRFRHSIEKHATALDHLSPKAVMGRGYALIRTAENRVVTSVTAIKKGDRLNIEFHDGTKSAVAEE